jgi:hypothetical protein
MLNSQIATSILHLIVTDSATLALSMSHSRDQRLDLSARLRRILPTSQLADTRSCRAGYGCGYNSGVARGWESKSVEEKQAEAASNRAPEGAPPTAAEVASGREKQRLWLSRQHVIQQLESAKNPRHRDILQRALADLESQLAQLV